MISDELIYLLSTALWRRANTQTHYQVKRKKIKGVPICKFGVTMLISIPKPQKCEILFRFKNKKE